MSTDYERARDPDRADPVPTPRIAIGHDIVAGCLRDCFGGGDWDTRWSAERYFVRYRIGEVEEMLSFTPREAIQSICVPSYEVLLPAAQAGMGMNLPEGIDQLSRDCMGIVETFVRCKHGLEHVLDTSRYERRLVKRLAKANPSRRSDELQYIWLKMVFGMAMRFLDVPAGDNCLEVIDREPGYIEEAMASGAVRWNPNFTDEEVGHMLAQRLGSRTFQSSRVSVN
jgi:hypothetical protein